MNIVLNERKKAEYIINSEDLGKEKGKNRVLLVKYFHSIGMTKDVIRKTLEDFLIKHDKDLNVDDPDTADYIDDIVKKYADDKFPLKETVINISEKELDRIKEVNNDMMESVLFIAMIYAKSNNNVWANMDIKDLFKYSNVRVNQEKQENVLFKLYNKGYFELSNKCDKLGLNLKYLDLYKADKSALIIEECDDNIILLYRRWRGYNIKKCDECGILIEILHNNTVLCKKCSKAKQLSHQKNSMKNSRNF